MMGVTFAEYVFFLYVETWFNLLLLSVCGYYFVFGYEYLMLRV